MLTVSLLVPAVSDTCCSSVYVTVSELPPADRVMTVGGAPGGCVPVCEIVYVVAADSLWSLMLSVSPMKLTGTTPLGMAGQGIVVSGIDWTVLPLMLTGPWIPSRVPATPRL